jgi:hypothetical protein
VRRFNGAFGMLKHAPNANRGKATPAFARMERFNDVNSETREIRLLLSAAAVNALLFTLALSFLTPGFESNDDVAMAQIASGVTTGTPSPELVFSNVAIGHVLAGLYRWTDRVNWYTLYLLAVHFASMSGLLYLFLRFRYSRLAVLVFFILFVQFEAALLLRLQFTSTAAMAGVIGLLLVLASGRNGERRSWLATALGGFLILLSGLIRSESMYYAVILVSPLLAYEAAVRRSWRTLATACLFVALGWTAIRCDDWHHRRDPRWRAFQEYNAARGAVHDLPIVEYQDNARFFFARVGWSYNDWGMFKSWFFTDAETFSYEHLKTLLDRFQGSTWIRHSPSQYLNESLEPISVFRSMMYADLLLAFLLCTGARFRLLLIALAECVVLEMMFLLFSYFLRLPARVVLPAFFAISVAGFFVVLDTASASRFLIPLPPSVLWNRWIRGALVAGFCGGFALISFPCVQEHDARSSGHHYEQRAFMSVIRKMVDDYAANEPGAIFLNWGGGLPLQLTPPFNDFREFRRMRVINLGWNTHSPLFQDELRRLEIDDLYRATFEDPRVRIFAARIYLKQLKLFAKEHYNRDIDVKHDDSFIVDARFPHDFGLCALNVLQMGPRKSSADAGFASVPSRQSVAASKGTP